MPSLFSLAALCLLPAAIFAINLDCKEIRTNGQTFNFKALGGPKDVHLLKDTSPSISNTTFTIDICKPLTVVPDIDSKYQCTTATRVCAIERDYLPGNEKPTIREVIDIAGEYTTSTGHSLEPNVTRLIKDDDSKSDSQQDGVRISLHGGQHAGTNQRAIIEFLCDPEMEGTEGFTDEVSASLTDPSSYRAMSRRDEEGGETDGEEGGKESGDEEDGKLPDLDKGKALQFVSYKVENKVGTLRLKWQTKYACAGTEYEEPSDDGSRGWGFFTWLLIVVFLLAAAYIIFGSWLNYNRYGARGWDLIPHGDAIRDLPYTIKDWFSGLIDRFRSSSSGSRGGYSAV